MYLSLSSEQGPPILIFTPNILSADVDLNIDFKTYVNVATSHGEMVTCSKIIFQVAGVAHGLFLTYLTAISVESA